MEDNRQLRVLVVDDTIVYRKIVGDVLSEIPGVKVVGTAGNGKTALHRIASFKPDLLTLDIEMPEMSGLDVLERMRKEHPGVGAIMVSSLTREGGDMTLKALELGAFDFIPKPRTGSMEENRRFIKNALAPILEAFSRRKKNRTIPRARGGAASSGTEAGSHLSLSSGPVRTGTAGITRRNNSNIVAIGISTGGPNALARMMPKLPADLGVPVLIVQHMPPVFTQSLARSLNSKCAIEVREAKDGEPLSANVALIAPGGKQMKIAAGADGMSRIVKLTDDSPENNCKPSADYLFRSVAHHYVGRATGVIMTGMGSDGTLGLKLMKRNGAWIIAQDETTCVVYGMPKGPVDAGIVDVIAPIERIAAEIVKTVKQPNRSGAGVRSDERMRIQ